MNEDTVKVVFDFIPLAVFFVIYKLYGIYAATASSIGIAVVQMIFMYLKYGRIEKILWISTVLLLILGGSTLLFQNELFIKWKPSILNSVFAILLLGNQVSGKELFIKKILGRHLVLPDAKWRKINLAWSLFFILLGGLNLFVVYNFSTDAWVNYKLFGTSSLTVLFIIVQGIFLYPDIKKQGN